MEQRTPSSFADVDDATLLAASQDDPRYFELLVQRHYDALVCRARALARGDRDLADDLVQETFVKAYRHATRYEAREGVPFRAWLMRILYTTYLSHWRAERRHPTVPLDEETSWALTETAAPGSGSELRSLLVEALARLPADAARRLRRYYLEGASCADLAREEGVSYTAAKVRLFRARRALRHALALVGYEIR